ncbi:unnamed protein product [Spirodela intermedia]|uniref:tRNA synthetases class I catalytic domain-containing protein n=1 Tax=Spirodela intermedia TaxID=51605 RepID=A0ABN7E7Y2_SPIIN|nr:unnamed protein product [Spirodela intermedia]
MQPACLTPIKHQTILLILSRIHPSSISFACKLTNTLTRSKQDFKPIQPNQVKMYVCGMTVYDFCHLGHARVMVVFDMVARWLRATGYQVTYVRNITDIDDKIIKRANENNETIQSLTQRFITAMDEDSAKLGICALTLNHAQLTCTNGDVFYKVRSFNDYGKLSGKSWKTCTAGLCVVEVRQPGEPYWESPGAMAVPAWHIECSVMSAAHLGQHFDIHGGGQDLHHPRLHHGQLLDAQCFVRVVRFFILRAHYRSPA